MTRSSKVRLVCGLLAALAARAEIIDRIAVSVGNRVVTRSDIERQIRVVAFQNGTAPDFSTANRHAIADKMTDQKLIQNELENGRYPSLKTADVAPALEEFKKNHFPDAGAYQKALADAGLTEQDLLDVLLWERTLLDFIEIRFETGIQVTEQEAAAYAQEHKVTTAEAEKSVIAARADQQVEQWLSEARRRTTIRVHVEALQ